jgi:hypothetical protein
MNTYTAVIVGLREVNELLRGRARKRIELECFHGCTNFVRSHGLPLSLATNEGLALIRTDLEISRVRQEGRSLPSIFLCNVTTDCAGLCGSC